MRILKNKMFQKKEVPLEVEIPTLHNPIKSHPFFYCEILFHSEMCHITKVQWFMCEVLLNCNGSTSFSNSSAHNDTTQSKGVTICRTFDIYRQSFPHPSHLTEETVCYIS